MSGERNWLEFFRSRQQSHAAAYLQFARDHARRDPAAHDKLEAESANLLQAAEQFWNLGERASVLALAQALWEQSDFVRTRGWMQRAIPLLEHAREAAHTAADAPAECAWLEALGYVHFAAANHAPAVPLYEQALALAQQTDNAQLQARVRLGMGRLYLDMGNMDSAAAFLTQARQDYAQARDPQGEIAALTVLGTLYTLRGSLAEAVQYLEQGSALARAVQNTQNEASLLYTLGYLATASRDWRQAAVQLEAAIKAAHAAGDVPLEARSMTSLGEVCLVQGKPQQAIAWLERALNLQKATDDSLTLDVTRFSLAKVYNALGDADKSLALLNLVYPHLFEMRHAPQGAIAAAYAAWVMADNHLKRQDAVEAARYLRDVLELAPPQLHDVRTAAETLLGSITPSRKE